MNTTRRVIYVTLILLALFTIVHGAAPASAEGDGEQSKTLTVPDVLYMESAGEFDISPDGAWAVWTKRTLNKEKNGRQLNIFLTNIADTVTFQVTRDFVTDSAPKFSPDGSLIAFIRSKGKEKPQIYLYDMKGGEPVKLTATTTGVRSCAWRNPVEILFTAPEDSTFREKTLKKKKDDAVVVADQKHYQPVRLFGIDKKGKKVKRITVNSGVITEFAVSPDGRWVVTNENQDINYNYDYRVPPKQFLLDLETNESREIFSEPHVNSFGFKWDNTSSGFFCFRRIASDSADTYVSIRHLFYYDLDSKRLGKVPVDWERGFGWSYGIVKGGAVATLADGVRDRIIHITKTKKGFGKPRLVADSGESRMLLGAGRGGNLIVYTSSTASSVPVIMTASIKNGKLKDEKELIRLNEKLKAKRLARTEVITWTGALDDEIEGILYYPLDYTEGERYPLVVSLHGGPSGVDRDFFTENWSNYPHLLASKGTFVLKVNYHGSGNYGLRWVESIKGHYYDYEVPDILSGVEHLVERSLVDKERVGIMGWSNGSILAIECCLRSDIFKALCAGAGDVNWISDYGNCAFGAAFDNAYLGGAPWDMPETYMRKSPLFRMHRMSTPTLILFGTEDTNVPTEQGWEHFRAMQQTAETPVRFILFPGAAHGLRKPSHQQRKMHEEIAWFEKYLFETYKAKNEAFDEDSPLALALEKARAQKIGHLLGVMERDILVPETVSFKGMRIGRFEVTRAQYREFDTDYTYPPGTDNHPVNGVSYEDARKYCEWLGEKTGRSFRLPNEKEMKMLLEKAGSNAARENNLEYWAGYPVTPDEQPLLEKKIEELERERSLIAEVGSFRPVGTENVYDLFGNVSEWVTIPDGTGRAMGLCAVTSRDERGAQQQPSPRYIGFRVIEDR